MFLLGISVLLDCHHLHSVSIKCLILKSEELSCHYVLFHTNPKTCKFYLVLHMMIGAAWKQELQVFF